MEPGVGWDSWGGKSCMAGHYCNWEAEGFLMGDLYVKCLKYHQSLASLISCVVMGWGAWRRSQGGCVFVAAEGNLLGIRKLCLISLLKLGATHFRWIANTTNPEPRAAKSTTFLYWIFSSRPRLSLSSRGWTINESIQCEANRSCFDIWKPSQ